MEEFRSAPAAHRRRLTAVFGLAVSFLAVEVGGGIVTNSLELRPRTGDHGGRAGRGMAEGRRRTPQHTCCNSGYGFKALPMTLYPYGLVGQFDGITLGCHSKWSCGTPPRASPESPT